MKPDRNHLCQSLRMGGRFHVAMISCSYLVAITMSVAGCRADEPGVSSSRPAESASSGSSSSAPADGFCVIWFHDCASSSLESLQIAANCPAITHVMLLDMHPNDSDWRRNPKTRNAIRVVKSSPARLIWCRDLTPYYRFGNFNIEDMYRSDFYIRAIRNIRHEAEEIGADGTALDTEPYGHSPFKTLAKSRQLPSASVVRQIADAVKEAVRQEGQVDFVLPAGSLSGGHPYHALAGLGRKRIAENTYSGRVERFASIPYDYEITGLYLHLVDREKDRHSRQYTPVREVFLRPGLWAGKEGIFLLPKRPEDAQVASELAKCYDRWGPIMPAKFGPSPSPEDPAE